MTILNIAITEQEALVAANTEGVRGTDGALTRCSKILVLPHANAVISGRGQLATIFNVFADAFGAMLDFDGTAAAMPSIVQRRFAESIGDLEKLGLGQINPDVQIVLIGWSDAQQRMAGFLYQPHGYNDLVKEGGVVAPWDPSWGATPNPSLDVEAMRALMAHQSLHAQNGQHPNMGWGGDVIFAKVTRDTVVTSWRAMR